VNYSSAAVVALRSFGAERFIRYEPSGVHMREDFGGQL
jgi:hypothetical protein